MKLSHHLFAGVLAGTLLAGAHADEPLEIADLAPEGTFLVIGVDRLDEICVRFDKTPLAGLLRSKPIRELYDREMKDGIDDMMEELGKEGLVGADGELDLPDSFGLAFFTDLDEETGMNKAFLMGFADWQSVPEAAGRVYDYMVEQVEDADDMRMDRKDVQGREVVVVETIEDEQDGGEDEEFGEFDAMAMFGDPSDLAPDLTTFYIVRERGRLIFANDLLAIDDALSAVDGDNRRPLSGVEAWKQTSSQLGDSDAYMGIFTDPLQDLLSPLFMGPLGIVKPLIGEVFGDIKAYGFSAVVPESDNVSLITSMSILAPGDKAGIPGLMRITSPVAAAPPRIVGENAFGYGMMNVDFKGLIPLANQIVSALPMGGEQMEMQLDQFGPMAEAALASMGPAMHVISMETQDAMAGPFANSTIAIPTSDPQKVQPLLALMGPGMDLEPREFKGETVWANETEGMAMSVAGNWVFMGSPKQVEQLVRSMDDPDGLAPLAKNRTFDAAVGSLPTGDVVAWGYNNVIEMLEAAQRQGMDMPNLDDMGGFDEFGPGNDLPFDPNMLPGLDALAPKDLEPYVGPNVWTFTTDDMGWVMRTWMLHPVEGGA